MLVRSGLFLLAILLAAPTTAKGIKLVELFQSQGCSSCPPANAALNAVADRPDVIALNYAVTYWDQLGWPDRFARPAFTARQRDYAAAMRSESVYTPQMVLNGRKAFVGNRPGELAAVLATAPALPGTAFKLAGGSVAASAEGPADLWLVRYDPEERVVAVKAGENRGRTLPHRNIVTDIERLGRAGAAPILLPPPIPGETRVLLLQVPGGGAVLDAVRLP